MSVRLRRSRAVALGLAAATIVAVIAGAVPAAGAAADVTAPLIKTNAAAAFVVGSTIGAQADDPFSGYFTWDISQLVKWTVTDNSGFVCGFELTKVFSDRDVNGVLLSVPSKKTSPSTGQYVDLENTDYDGDSGGRGDTPVGWSMSATDCSGNSTTAEVVNAWELGVLQEDNSAASNRAVVGQLTYTGTWGTSSCACFSSGATRKTSAKGASFTFSRLYERDDHVALVMPKGPGRGQAAVYVDGVKTATINTYAAANTNRVVVYDKWMPAGTHTVRVVNLATAGHPRIDLDAVLTN